MLHNEDDYPEPSLFRPERFLKHGQLDPDVRDPALMAFGFGRRSVFAYLCHSDMTTIPKQCLLYILDYVQETISRYRLYG